MAYDLNTIIITHDNPQSKTFHSHPTGTIIYDPKTLTYYQSSGGQSIAIGVNNKITGSSKIGVADSLIEKDALNFIKNHLDLIENNSFDSFYTKVFVKFQEDSKYMVPEFVKIFKNCGINDLNYLSELPPYYLWGNQKLYSFTIPSNIKSICFNSLKGAANLYKIIWKTKDRDDSLNFFPSYYCVLYALESRSNFLSIDFPDHKYDKKWVKNLKLFLKKKRKENNYKAHLYIKFNNKRKEIKIV